MLKYKTQTVISVLGLTIGVVFFAYGYQWYKFETTFDSFYPDSGRIYQVYGTLKSTGKQTMGGQIPYIASRELEQAFPEIESVAILYPNYGSAFLHGDRDIGFPKFEFVDERFLHMFPPEVVAGVVHENSLKNNDELIITESFAREHFGTSEEALGETLVSSYNESYVIQAVIADPPANSIFQNQGYLPDTHARPFYDEADEKTQWRDFYSVRLYIKLNQYTDVERFGDKLFTFALDNGYNDDLLLELCPLFLVRSMVEATINTDFFTMVKSDDKLGITGISGVEWVSKPFDFNPLFQSFEVEVDFVERMGLKIIEGRNIQYDDFTHRWVSNKVLINETAKRVMQMGDPIGQKLVIPDNSYSSDGRGKSEYEIVGIVEDFHTVGLQSEIPPLIIKGQKRENGGYYVYARTLPGMEEEAVKAINELIPRFRPDNKDEILVHTMSRLLSDLTKSEKDQLRLFATLASLCILIAIFGIYSVSQRETQRRQKEIAIRKTAGAYTREITTLFFREYITITLISCAVGLPLAWLFMQRWLETFAYRISIEWWMFVLVIAVVSAIVSVTIVSQVVRAASQNPAEVIKSE